MLSYVGRRRGIACPLFLREYGLAGKKVFSMLRRPAAGAVRCSATCASVVISTSHLRKILGSK
ncbi:hypothetical protein SBA1_470025 [Candidatus Sulfotelmatobacter kueseliae]|uniref:Uncharacterized protein n=1 Tax=Candidatus Sulfotelmatobacter kueseliae TaxID=2042962 RepID=A0A2U3KT06_9BACT|nr:hypothetical protein SBA1_470025 [Candidatus Sulfotelmatobacter kueseliae]